MTMSVHEFAESIKTAASNSDEKAKLKSTGNSTYFVPQPILSDDPKVIPTQLRFSLKHLRRQDSEDHSDSEVIISRLDSRYHMLCEETRKPGYVTAAGSQAIS